MVELFGFVSGFVIGGIWILFYEGRISELCSIQGIVMISGLISAFMSGIGCLLEEKKYKGKGYF